VKLQWISSSHWKSKSAMSSIPVSAGEGGLQGINKASKEFDHLKKIYDNNFRIDY